MYQTDPIHFAPEPSSHLHQMRQPLFALALGLLLACGLAQADNTAGVFGPDVTPAQEALEYRGGFDPDSSDLIQRLHYQSPLGNGEDLRARIVYQTRKSMDRTLDFDFVQAELQWQLGDLQPGWKQALRFDGRVSGDSRPGLVALSYIQDRRINSRWAVRGLVLGGLAVGNDAPSGLDLQARAHLRYQPRSGMTLGLEWFSFFGRTSDLPGFSEQTHQFGPFMSLKAGRRWQLFAGVLGGLTDASDDVNLRLWLTRSL